MKRCFERNPYRELPDGTITRVYPFHVSLQGLEARILSREDSDYDAFVKYLCLSARRRNVILVIYAVVSNHSHCVILGLIDLIQSGKYTKKKNTPFSGVFLW